MTRPVVSVESARESSFENLLDQLEHAGRLAGRYELAATACLGGPIEKAGLTEQREAARVIRNEILRRWNGGARG